MFSRYSSEKSLINYLKNRDNGFKWDATKTGTGVGMMGGGAMSIAGGINDIARSRQQ